MSFGLFFIHRLVSHFQLQEHRNNFITIDDFNFLYRHGINTVRIPVGWWIAYDPDPPPPFIGGSLEALDNAFSWAQYVFFFLFFLPPSKDYFLVMDFSCFFFGAESSA